MKTASYSASGISMGSMKNMALSTDNVNQNTRIKRSTQKSTGKKQLNYNPREIRSALMRASKSQSANKVLCQAKSKLSTLMKCKGTGQYNETELTNAIVHARRMVQCARLKTQNLKKEEQLQKKYAKEAKADEESQKNDIKRRVRQKEQALEQKEKVEILQKARKQKQHNQEIIRKRRMHRNTERGKMDEADLEYKKNMDRDSKGIATGTGYAVSMPIEGIELAFSENALKMAEEEIEQETEMMIRAELGMTGTSVSLDGASAAAFTGTSVSSDTASVSHTGTEVAVNVKI